MPAMTIKSLSEQVRNELSAHGNINIRLLRKKGPLPSIGTRPSSHLLEHGNTLYYVGPLELTGARQVSEIQKRIAEQIWMYPGQANYQPRQVIICKDGLRLAPSAVLEERPATINVVRRVHRRRINRDRSGARIQPFMANVINDTELTDWIESMVPDMPHLVEIRSPLLKVVRKDLLDRSIYFDEAKRLRADEPDWARRRQREGTTLHRFRPANFKKTGFNHPRYRDTLFQLSTTISQIKSLSDSALQHEAESLVRGLNHQTWSDLSELIDALSRRVESRFLRARMEKVVQKPRSIWKPDSPFRAVEVSTLRDLSQLGREANNCLREGGVFWEDLAEDFLNGRAQFWSIRDGSTASNTLVAILRFDIDDDGARSLSEVKGPQNNALKVGHRRVARWLVEQVVVHQPTLELVRLGVDNSVCSPMIDVAATGTLPDGRRFRLAVAAQRCCLAVKDGVGDDRCGWAQYDLKDSSLADCANDFDSGIGWPELRSAICVLALENPNVHSPTLMRFLALCLG